MSLSHVLDMVLPRRCLLCANRARKNLCAGCDADLPAIEGACFRCGIPLDFPQTGIAGPHNRGQETCGACTRKPPPYDRTVAALDYRFPVTVLAQRFKFNRSFACGAILASRMVRAVDSRACLSEMPVEALVPVPLHASRQFLRVFNQAEVLARDLGKALGIPVASRALRRTRRTPAQSGLSARDRSQNLTGAFKARSIDARHVALVDDVMTTGTTAGECTKVLKRAGVETVAVWVAARAV